MQFNISQNDIDTISDSYSHDVFVNAQRLFPCGHHLSLSSVEELFGKVTNDTCERPGNCPLCIRKIKKVKPDRGFQELVDIILKLNDFIIREDNHHDLTVNKRKREEPNLAPIPQEEKEMILSLSKEEKEMILRTRYQKEFKKDVEPLHSAIRRMQRNASESYFCLSFFRSRVYDLEEKLEDLLKVPRDKQQFELDKNLLASQIAALDKEMMDDWDRTRASLAMSEC